MEYMGVKLTCCENLQKVELSGQQELDLSTNGPITINVICNKCGSQRTLKVTRNGDTTYFTDVTPK